MILPGGTADISFKLDISEVNKILAESAEINQPVLCQDKFLIQSVAVRQEFVENMQKLGSEDRNKVLSAAFAPSQPACNSF